MSYCLKCKKQTESKDTRIVLSKNGRTSTRQSMCGTCGTKKSQFAGAVVKPVAEGVKKEDKPVKKEKKVKKEQPVTPAPSPVDSAPPKLTRKRGKGKDCEADCPCK